MVHTDDSRPSAFTFANHVGIQTDDSDNEDMPAVPEELRQTIGSHLPLTNLEVSAAISPSMLLQPPRHPHLDGPTHMTMNQLLDAQLKLDQAHQQRHISKMLTGVVTNMHCLTKFSREAGLTPCMGHTHYLYACYLKSQISSRSPPSECNLESVWSCQVDLDKDMPKACALALTPDLNFIAVATVT